jgi:hypothetical protein
MAWFRSRGAAAAHWPRIAIGASLVAVASMGCSLIQAGKPPGIRPESTPRARCRALRTAPTADGIVFGASAIAAVVILAQPCGEGLDCLHRAAVLPLGTMSVGYGASALSGFLRVTRCEQALEHVEEPATAASARAGTADRVGPGSRFDVRLAVVKDGVADVRTAPAAIAPVLLSLSPRDRVLVSPISENGWRQVRLFDGRFGYVEDAKVSVESVPARE